MASKMAARNKCKRLMYIIFHTVLKHLNTPNQCILFLQYMFKLFNDKFKDGLTESQGQGQIQGQTQNIAKNQLFTLISFVITPKYA